MIEIFPGDNRASLAALPENSIDAVVTDPPYSLTSITKRFGKDGAAPARSDRNDGSFARVSGGFMGKAWDATGIERDPAFWAAVYRVMKPGAFVFAFSGARTGHWQACAMEQAGFIMHPMHAWLYGSGFPKGHDASKAIDRRLGVEGSRGAYKPGYENRTGRGQIKSMGEAWSQPGGFHRPWMDDPDAVDAQARRYEPASPEAQAWDGWKYGTQTQKPAMEPIYLGQKPYEGKPVESILKWGVGAFNVDGCRVPVEAGRPLVVSDRRSGNLTYGDGLQGSRAVAGGTDLGRYPANVLHDGSPEVVALFPESKGQLAKASTSTDTRKTQHVYGAMMHGSGGQEPRGDDGSAARFFNSFPADDTEDVEAVLAERNAEIDYRGHSDIDVPPAFYHAKAGKADRAGSKHPTVKPIGLLRHLVRHICPPGGVVLDPFAGSGTTAEAARLEGMSCVLMEAEPEYVAFLRARFVSALSPHGKDDPFA